LERVVGFFLGQQCFETGILAFEIPEKEICSAMFLGGN
jgi:hypothetical protein